MELASLTFNTSNLDYSTFVQTNLNSALIWFYLNATDVQNPSFDITKGTVACIPCDKTEASLGSLTTIQVLEAVVNEPESTG